jgi:hypothetical protein
MQKTKKAIFGCTQIGGLFSLIAKMKLSEAIGRKLQI